MKKLRAKIIKESLAPVYGNPTPNLPAWTTVRPEVFKTHAKKLLAKLKRKRAVAWLDDLIQEYIQGRIQSIRGESTLSVIKTYKELDYRVWLAHNFPTPEHDETLHDARLAYWDQLYGVAGTMMTMAAGEYPFSIVKSDFKNYRLKKFRPLSMDPLRSAVATRRFLVTDKLQTRWRNILMSKYGLAVSAVRLPNERDLDQYETYLARTELNIRFAEVLSVSRVRELRQLHADILALGDTLDFNEFILHEGKFPPQ